MKILNIGVLAHVDAGKTTVTENLLFKSGAIKKLGRVDRGDTHTDTLSLEKARGITIKASTISYNWKGIKVNIIDTPGHVDFVAEVQRSLSILDGAILVISAKEGVQSHTRVLFDVLRDQRIPTIIFINKLDRTGVDLNKIIEEIRTELSGKILCLSETEHQGSRAVNVRSILDREGIKPDHYEVLCNYDSYILDRYILEEDLQKEYFIKKLSDCTQRSEIYPIFMGVGILGLGIEDLLDGINQFLFAKEYNSSDNRTLSGIVYKVTRDRKQRKSIYVRLYSGTLRVRDCFHVRNKDVTDKVTKIEIFENGKLREVNSVSAGDIAIISGLNHFSIGDYLGDQPDCLRHIELGKPTLKAKVMFEKDKMEKNKVFIALSLLAEEDPLLEVERESLDGDIYVRIFGEVQMEIIQSTVLDLYQLEITFSETTTIYKEAPIGKGRAVIHMRERINPFAAAVTIEVEPLSRGEGIQYVSNVTTGYLTKSFQNAVEEAVLNCCKQGIYGWEITDIKIIFVDAVYDSVESTPSDFRDLTPMVFMEALYEAGTKLLEPIYKFELKISNEVGGKAMNDLKYMGADIQEITNFGESIVVKGEIPMDTSKSYGIKVASYTGGRGVFLMEFQGYRDIPENRATIPRDKNYIDPLNKMKYLLQKSNAVKSKL